MPAATKTTKILLTLSAAAFLLCAAALDLRARAKAAWLKAELYAGWQRRPELKKNYFDAVYDKKAGILKKKTAPQNLKKELEALEAEKKFLLNESSAKYAYIWYRTAAEDFCRPQNKWCDMAHKKTLPAKELWKAELREKNIKAEDWMLD